MQVACLHLISYVRMYMDIMMEWIYFGVLLLVQSLTKATDIFYVVPDHSTNFSCTSQPCGTLNQYLLDNGTLAVVSDIQYHFFPGEHKVTANIVLQNLQNFSFVGSSNTQPTVLACNSQKSIAIVFSYNVTISNFVFKQCNGNSNGSKNTHIEDAILDHNLVAIKASLFIESCLFCEIQNIKFLQYGLIGINMVENSRLYNITVILNGLQSSGIILSYLDCENCTDHDLIILNSITITGDGSKGILIKMQQTQYIMSVIIMNSHFYYMNKTVLQVEAVTLIGVRTLSKTYTLLIKSCLFYSNNGRIIWATVSTHYNSIIKIIDCNFTSNTNGHIEAIITALASYFFIKCGQAIISMSNCDFLYNNNMHLHIYNHQKCTSNIIKLKSIQICHTRSAIDMINIYNMIVQAHGPILFANNKVKNIMKFNNCDIEFNKNITFTFNFCSHVLSIFSGQVYIKIMESTNLVITNNSYLSDLIAVDIYHDFNKPYPFCLFQYIAYTSHFSPTQYSIIIKYNTDIDKLLHFHKMSLLPLLEPFSYKPMIINSLTFHCKWIQNTSLNLYHPTKINKDIIQTDEQLYYHNYICCCHENGTHDCTIDELGPLYPGQMLQEKVCVLYGENISVLYTETNNELLPNSTCKIAHKTEVLHTISTDSDPVNFTIASESNGECELFLTAQPYLHKFYDAFYIKVLPCPMGFTLQNGICECDPLLYHSHIHIEECNIEESTITRLDNTWIAASIHSKNTEYSISHNCPMDYCLPYSSSLNLLTPDMQCQFNRTGILCSQCQHSLSMVFGSSRCIHCTNNAKSILIVAITVVFAGILLVIFLYLLNLTVTKGTINGIILYANIVSINDFVFLVNDKVYKPLRVFISFTNLDLGIEMCFYSGMDSYAKTFLQLFFPFYLIAIAISIIVASRYSSRLLRWTYTRSLPVLATLFLLSYTGLLRVALMVLFSYSSITELPSGHQRFVWSIDASVPLFGLKFTILFIVCLLLFLLLVPFNIVLLFTRFLSQFKIINHFKPMLDAFQGSYKTHQYYWVAVHIILRSLFFTLYAFPSEVNLVLSTMFLILFCIVYGSVHPYKNKLVNIQELLLLINLTLMYAVSYQSSNDVFSVVTNIMIGLAFMQFCVIVLYHFLTYTFHFNISATLKYCKTKAYNCCSNRESDVSSAIMLDIPERTYNYREYQDKLISDDFK